MDWQVFLGLNSREITKVELHHKNIVPICPLEDATRSAESLGGWSSPPPYLAEVTSFLWVGLVPLSYELVKQRGFDTIIAPI
jgi:hypothetical protein